MKCDICGHDLTRIGTCQRTVKYNKKTGAFNHGRTCHTGCAHNHFEAHMKLSSPQRHDFRITHSGGSIATESAETSEGALASFLSVGDRRRTYTLSIERRYDGQWQMIDAGTFRHVAGKWTRVRVG